MCMVKDFDDGVEGFEVIGVGVLIESGWFD